MKGLMLKDFKLLKMQKKFIILILVLAVFMIVSSKDISFAIGYLTFLLPFFAISTISYDEFDNGNAFLFSLPISRKGYALEKYCFTFILGGIALILGAIMSICYGIFTDMSKGLDLIYSALVAFCAMSVFISVMLPIQLKYGGEKGRIVIFAISGGVAVLGFLGYKFLPLDKIFVFFEMMITDYLWLLILSAILCVALIVFISIQISIKIMKNKQF